MNRIEQTIAGLKAQLAEAPAGTGEAWALGREIERQQAKLAPVLTPRLVGRIMNVIDDSRATRLSSSVSLHGAHSHNGTAKGLVTREINKLRKEIAPAEMAAYVDAATARFNEVDEVQGWNDKAARLTKATLIEVRERLTA